MDDFDLRFGGISRLYSAEGLQRLREARVCVVGLGGVGSWSAEALARSAVGRITLVDMDDICASNVNRQLQALDGVFGRPKVDVLAERIRAINPHCLVQARTEFFTPSTAEEILQGGFSYVIDAIDNVPNKCLLIARCRGLGLRIVTVGGAGGRRDPTSARVTDLAQTTHDNLLLQVRKKLRDDYGFPRESKQPFNVPCVFSPERAVYPGDAGSECATPAEGAPLRLGCESGYGTASFVTGTFAFLAAGCVVNAIAGGIGA